MTELLPLLQTQRSSGVIVQSTKRAIIYCRVSSPGQKENGSLEEQEARCRAWCQEHGYEIIAVYHEIYSGEDIERPRLEEVRDEIRAGSVDVVIADKVDRFSRADPAITAYVMVEAQQYGCTIEFVEVQDDSFEGQILAAVLSIVARVEHRRIKERTSAGKRRRIMGDPSKGKQPRLMPGNIPRYGWKYRDETKSAYDIEPSQAAIVERIYRELAEQGRSLSAICRDLDAEREPPPAEAQVRAGHTIGKRRTSMRWHSSSVARMLKEPFYWGEPIAYRYEQFKKEVRDPQTNRIRKKKGTRYRQQDPDTVVRYSTDIWPPIVSKDLAMQALARLQQNQLEAERYSKNSKLSFLRAGYLICGYCGANMVLHNHKATKDEPAVVRVVCGRHRSYTSARRPDGLEDCPSNGQFSIRMTQVEDTVWQFIVETLSDPHIVPDAYERLGAREQEVEAERETRLRSLNKLIEEATQRRLNFMTAIGESADDDVRKGLLKLATEETAQLRTWQAERERIERIAAAEHDEVRSVRSFIAEINSRVAQMLQATIPEKRKLVEALGVRVVVYRMQHQPWFELGSDLPGLAATWHSHRRKHATLLAVRDEETVLSDLARRHAIHKWTAPVPNHTQSDDITNESANTNPEREKVGV